MINNSVEPEILIIDDNPDFAQSASNLIHAKYGFACIPLCNKDDVIIELQHNIIKVVVIDQVMPEIKGTELFQEIKKISPTTKAIMLTGEATSEEIGKAINIGFSSYLDKKDIKKLPDAVFEQYINYDNNYNKCSNNIELFIEKKFFVFPIISYSLISINKINNNYVADDLWKTAITIHAGEEHELEHSIEFEDKITMTTEYESKIKGEFDLCEKKYMMTLKETLNTELNKKYSTQHTIQHKEKHRSKKTFSLAKEPEDHNSPHIVKRVIEYVPIFNEYIVVIRKRCKLCKSYKIFPITVYKQTNKIKTRQIDYFNDGTIKETNTGIEKF